MTDLDDLDLFSETTPPNPAAVARRCLHPRDKREPVALPGEKAFGVRCGRCGKVLDPGVARRGRNNRARGNSIEREIGKALGLRRVGQYGGPDDLSGELFAVQVKSGGSFPERLYAWLRAVPVTASQTPLLVVTDAPGPGRRRRALVVLELDQWVALHGEAT